MYAYVGRVIINQREVCSTQLTRRLPIKRSRLMVWQREQALDMSHVTLLHYISLFHGNGYEYVTIIN